MEWRMFPLMKISKLLCLSPCGLFPPMDPCGLILTVFLPIRLIYPLCTSWLLSRLPMKTSLSHCPLPETVVVNWLEWKTDGSVVFSKCNPLRLIGCKPPITLIWGKEGLGMITREVAFIPIWLYWADFFITNSGNRSSPSHVSSGFLR